MNLKLIKPFGKIKFKIMHIFITGIAGFLGSNLAEFYLKKNYKVSGCDNLVGGDLSNINLKKINFYKGNCENLNFMTKIMKGADVVCHTAAYAHEGLSSFSPTLISNNIVTGSTSVFTAAIKNKLKRIVFCSSMARYGNQKAPFTEEMQTKPVDPYGIAKYKSYLQFKKILNEVNNQFILSQAGESLLIRHYKIINLLDWVSYYLAILYKTDPTPVKRIKELKGV